MIGPVKDDHPHAFLTETPGDRKALGALADDYGWWFHERLRLAQGGSRGRGGTALVLTSADAPVAGAAAFSGARVFALRRILGE
jgi:hypothetical protein